MNTTAPLSIGKLTQGLYVREHLHAATRYILMTILVLFGTQGLSNSADDNRDVVVIVSQNSPVTSISKASLRAIFGMRKRIWQDGAAITVFVLDGDDPTHIEFSKKVLQTFPYILRRIWERQVYSGTGQAPTTVSSQDEMQRAIATTQNAIGYIRRDRLNEQVKMVEIQ